MISSSRGGIRESGRMEADWRVQDKFEDPNLPK